MGVPQDAEVGAGGRGRCRLASRCGGGATAAPTVLRRPLRARPLRLPLGPRPLARSLEERGRGYAAVARRVAGRA